MVFRLSLRSTFLASRCRTTLRGQVSIDASSVFPYVAVLLTVMRMLQAGTGECDQHSVADGSCLTFVDEGTDITFTMTYRSALLLPDTSACGSDVAVLALGVCCPALTRGT
eukprot:3229135-Rhodomonas_salina.1